MYTRGFLEYTLQSAIKARRLSHQGGDPMTAPEAVGSTSDFQVVEKSIAQEPRDYHWCVPGLGWHPEQSVEKVVKEFAIDM